MVKSSDQRSLTSNIGTMQWSTTGGHHKEPATNAVSKDWSKPYPLQPCYSLGWRRLLWTSPFAAWCMVSTTTDLLMDVLLHKVLGSSHWDLRSFKIGEWSLHGGRRNSKTGSDLSSQLPPRGNCLPSLTIQETKADKTINTNSSIKCLRLMGMDSGQKIQAFV